MKYLDETTQTYKEITVKALDSMPIGSIIQFAGSVIPNGWMICDGRTLRVGLGSNQTYLGEYADLYKVIGTTYGYVEYPIPMVGAIDFKIPDLRGKVPVGQDGNDTDFEDLGNTGGDKTHKHTGGSHTHGLANGYACIGTGWDGSNILRQQTKGTITAGTRGMPNMPGYNNTSTSAYDASALGGSTDAGGVVDTTSSSSLQPYLVVNYIIKVKNTTPTMASVVNATNSSTEDSYSCGYINNLVDYSTTETKTGAKWIDGKPIYRKVLLASKSDFSATNHLYAIPNGVSNLKDYTHIEARLKRTSDVWNEIPNGFGVASANGWSVTINDITKTSISIQIGNDTYYYLETDNSVIVIIEYTKTTD